MTECRRIAVVGGVYANAYALSAALDDMRHRDVDAVYCLGDMGGFGPRPDNVFPLLRDGRVLSIQGNYDEAIASGAGDCGCGYSDPRDNHYARISYAYTAARTSTENVRWLPAPPGPRRLPPRSAGALLCHGSPRPTN